MKIFDDASAGGGAHAMMARLKLVSELGRIRKDLIALPKGLAGMGERLKLVKRANEVRAELKASSLAADPAKAMKHEREAPEPVNSPRRATVGFYSHDGQRTKGQRQKANDAAIDLLSKVQSGELSRDELTDDDRAVLAGYSGNGGALVGADGKKGSAYEYYTPTPIAEGVWDALGTMGFSGGKVLDPAAGTGVFGAAAPRNAAVDAVELDATSGNINDLVNSGPGYSTTIEAFEGVAAATPDESYDAVVTNVPFGTVADRGGNQNLDPKYQKDTLEAYFILRSLDKLKPGGLAAFVVPPRCVSGRGGAEVKLRQRASIKGEFLGAFRLPNSVFGAADADTITDIIFFRKYGRDAAEKIAELQEQSPDTLATANVMWSDFVEGRYFKGEGKRFILGEFVPKDPDKFRDVDRVKNPASIPEVAKMIRRLPGSRVDWEMLEASETQPIVYREGDTITQAGQTLVLKDGDWQALAGTGSDAEGQALLSRFKDAYAAFDTSMSYEDAVTLRQYMRDTSQALDMPGWLTSALSALDKLPDSDARERAWAPGLVGLAVTQVLDENGRGSGTDFLSGYAKLSEAMQQHAAAAKRIKGVDGDLRRGLGELTTHYGRKTGHSALWRGDVQDAPVSQVSAEHGFEGLLYENQSSWVSLEQARTVLGDGFSPFESDDWCVSADGSQICRADDYYIGSYGDFVKRIDAEMAAAPNDNLRAKLQRQKAVASERIDRVDVSRITFNLFSPYVTTEEKAEFLRRFVHPGAVVTFDEKTSEPRVEFDIPGSQLTDQEKLIRRIGAYLKNGTITLGGTKLDQGDAEGIRELRAMINKANEQFNGWARGNKGVVSRLEGQANDPEKLRFAQPEDESPLSIPGMNPELELHGYQNAYVRSRARDFSGINGFDVGLGKTFTSLAVTQYAQSIGVKKKTCFVVPNSVLSNWQAETAKAYASTDDCLYVGLRDGEADPSAYDEDLNRVMENRHRKIFMTMEAFQRIRLRGETIKRYEQYMRSADSSFAESEDRKTDERAKGKAATIVDVLTNKSGSAPYLEDMGIDSLVIDEAHAYKNSATTVDFTGGKYLSLSPASMRGLDAQAKAWAIRGGSGSREDGVITLTATPITNSPLEMYSMMALSVGHDRVNDLFVGTSGADGFMDAVCQIENEDDETIDGESRAINVFKGLNNVEMLRGALRQVATIKNANDVGGQIKVPEAPERAATIQLPEETITRLEEYKEAYRYAADALAERGENRGDAAAFERISGKFGESMELIGHPFNLINKMTMLIADPDLDARVSRYLVAEGQMEAAQALVDKWNAKPPTEQRTRPGPNATADEAVSVKTIRDVSREVVGRQYKMPVKAWIENGAIVLDTVNSSTQDRFEGMADKAEVEVDVSIPPKLAAMIENVQAEAATPRGVDSEGNRIPYAKQIVFCDLLGMHNKIRRLLSRRAGVPSSAIAIVTGQRNNSPEEIMAVQDGFNAPGESNQYRAIIANEKAEVGINLQKGTQAIHHLTIGWTPDSLTQRNGRGVRQGNKTAQVTVYHYDADGTFDTAKRSLVNSKADWIGEMMQPDGGDSLAISGGMSREQMESLIDAVGDADAVTRVQEAIAAKDAERRATSNRERQRINLDTITKQNQFLAENGRATDWVARKMGQFMNAMGQAEKVRSRLSKPKMSESARAKNESILAELEVKERGLQRQIEEAATFYKASYDYQTRTTTRAEGEPPIDVRAVVTTFLDRAKRGENRAPDLIDALRAGRLGYGHVSIEVDETADLVNEWHAEIDMAAQMRSQAVESYAKQAGLAGGMPKGVADAFANGEGVMIADTPVIAECFIVAGGNNYVVSKESLSSYRPSARGYVGGDIDTAPLHALVPVGEVAYPGSAKHDECLAAAAKIEDDEERNGKTVSLYSDACPAVATQRETDISASYPIYHYSLPSPHFPLPIRPEEAEGSTVLSRIYDEQKAVILRWEDMHFVVNNSVEVVREKPPRADALRDYAIAHNLKLSESDIAGHVSPVKALIREGIDEEQFERALTGETGEEIGSNVERYMESAVPWFDFDGEAHSYLPLHLQRKAMLAVASKAVDDAGEEAPEPEPEGDPDDMVMIEGDTRAWKDRIKEYGTRYGSYRRWVRKELAWRVRRQAWKALISDHPRAAQELNLRG
ncbi:N-6 DNA methylase [Halomonas janggokensis]|uniref:N-6 DNA methylase n=1 Tax=Vreelandella janggokensis TaxID=370767 RepID=A0ABT4IRZ9_9GAMM|nr:N-6 DNA methylase [Halomonas janggokensis]MCZ0926436.1 N-6 DNA methylase [Halomonas janggokensis]MCZ0928974.1 N-6 DNA methylase [Halomonas janggokensis]